MKTFYIEYSQDTILPPLVAEISWSKNCVIMEKCKNPPEREFYIKMTKRYGWTKDVLINNIENKAFEKYLSNQTNFDETVPEKYRLQAKLAVFSVSVGRGVCEPQLVYLGETKQRVVFDCINIVRAGDCFCRGVARISTTLNGRNARVPTYFFYGTVVIRNYK